MRPSCAFIVVAVQKISIDYSHLLTQFPKNEHNFWGFLYYFGINTCKKHKKTIKRKLGAPVQSLCTDWFLRMDLIINWFFSRYCCACFVQSLSGHLKVFVSIDMLKYTRLFWVYRLHAVRSMICLVCCCAELDNRKKCTWKRNKNDFFFFVCLFFALVLE